MKEQISAELLKLLQSANSATEGASSFLQQKLPELCHQIVSWNIAFDTFFMVLFGVPVVWAFWCLLNRWPDMKDADSRGSADTLWAMALVTALVGIFFFSVNAVDLIKNLMAPDMVVLDYFRHMR